MLFKPKLFWVVLAILFFIFNMASTASLENEDARALDAAPAPNEQPVEEEANDVKEDVDQLQEETKMEDEVNDPESPELNNEPLSNEDDKRNQSRKVRKLRISCYCWIGWIGGTKYQYFGSVRKFRLFERNKQVKCSATCSRECAPWLQNKAYLCKKIGRTYHYKWEKVGCFSKVGRRESYRNLWDFDGSPPHLCCKKVLSFSSCKLYGAGFYYHVGMKFCVKYLAPGPIPDIPNGFLKSPVCCYRNKLYACQKPKYVIKPVPCW